MSIALYAREAFLATVRELNEDGDAVSEYEDF